MRPTPNSTQSTPGSFGTVGGSTSGDISNAPPSKTGTSARRFPTTSLASNLRPTIDVRYVESSVVQVRGSVTGRIYQFSAARRIQAVDARDPAPLLGTRFFRRT